MTKELKHKNICVSMNAESLKQLIDIAEHTGKSKSRIVRDAIQKEYKGLNNGQKEQTNR